jgi:hypothetical protein
MRTKQRKISEHLNSTDPGTWNMQAQDIPERSKAGTDNMFRINILLEHLCSHSTAMQPLHDQPSQMRTRLETYVSARFWSFEFLT